MIASPSPCVLWSKLASLLGESYLDSRFGGRWLVEVVWVPFPPLHPTPSPELLPSVFWFLRFLDCGPHNSFVGEFEFLSLLSCSFRSLACGLGVQCFGDRFPILSSFDKHVNPQHSDMFMFLLFPRNYFPVGVRVDLQLAATHSCDHPACELGIRCAEEALLLLL